MPKWRYLYTCSSTGVKVYELGGIKKIVHPDGKTDYKKTKR